MHHTDAADHSRLEGGWKIVPVYRDLKTKHAGPYVCILGMGIWVLIHPT
jgi:hypothetical protein